MAQDTAGRTGFCDVVRSFRRDGRALPLLTYGEISGLGEVEPCVGGRSSGALGGLLCQLAHVLDVEAKFFEELVDPLSSGSGLVVFF